MKAHFQALRSLLKTPNLGLPADTRDLYQAAASFERSNRGHQNQLDALASALAKGNLSEDAKFRNRASTLRATTRALLDASGRTPTAALPDNEAFQAFWTMKDESGSFQRLTLELLESIARWQDLPKGFELELSRLRLENGALTLEQTFRHRESKLRAERTFNFANHGMDNLMGCSRTLREFRRLAKENIVKLASWPEFSANAQSAAIADACRRRMKDFLAGCSSQERDWFANNWSLLRVSAPL